MMSLFHARWCALAHGALLEGSPMTLPLGPGGPARRASVTLTLAGLRKMTLTLSWCVFSRAGILGDERFCCTGCWQNGAPLVLPLLPSASHREQVDRSRD